MTIAGRRPALDRPAPARRAWAPLAPARLRRTRPAWTQVARARDLSLGVAVLLAAASTLAACNVALERVTRLDQRTFDIASGAQTSLTVGTFNGHITVTAMAQAAADITVTAVGTGPSRDIAKQALDSVSVAMTQSGAALSVAVTTTGDGPVGGGRSADVDVILPPEASLTLTSSNGRIEATNVKGTVHATTSNGQIVTRAGHDLDLETSNGTITMSQPAGTLTAHTSNAAIDILNADSVVADVESSNGPLSFSGSLSAGDQSFRTSNGSLDLRLPPGQGFSLAAHTTNGAVRTDFPGLTVSGATASGTTGDGSARVTAETSNGALSVTRLTP